MDEFKYHAPSAKAGILYIRSLPDATVLEAAREEGDAFYSILVRMGQDTNRSWITAQAAEVAYDRGLIDEQELDWITR